MELCLAAMIGYFLGSIPFAIVIGKVFFKKDIRKYGSKNPGGSNAGRVLGKKAGLAVMVLDLLKVVFAIFIASCLGENDAMMVVSGLAAGIGHCFPVFARFKGGKAVATLYGFLFGMAVVGPYDLRIFILPLFVFLSVLYIWKIISLSSICSAIFVAGYFAILEKASFMTGALLVFAVLIVWRHRTNIERMLRHEENKISWM